jgi:hypothetical protein
MFEPEISEAELTPECHVYQIHLECLSTKLAQVITLESCILGD